MRRDTGRTTTLPLNLPCRIYLAAVLAAATLSSLPYPPVALVLLLAIMASMLRPFPRLDIIVSLAVLFLLPLMVSSFLPHLSQLAAVLRTLAVVPALPALYLLDSALRRNAGSVTPVTGGTTRVMTPVSRALFTAAIAVLLLSAFLNNRVLTLSAAVFFLYLFGVLLPVLKRVPADPIDIVPAERRIVACTAADIVVTATPGTKSRLYCYASPIDSFVSVAPREFTLHGSGVDLRLSVTPPLAGPTKPGIRASVIDSRGFIQTNQVVEPLVLQVIPRARYAEWLAKEYLEQTGSRATASSALRSNELPTLPIGAEYYHSRTYQAGDRLKDIDWRHTIKLRQLITKEYAVAGGQSAVIAVNLSVADEEGADRLAFNMITTALTLAQQAIPTALTAYNHERVVATVPLTDPDEVLRRTLSLVKDIAQVAVPEYFLQPPDVRKLRRNMSQLKQAESLPARHLLEILDLEYRAIDEGAKKKPATLALTRIMGQLPPPAIVILVSQLDSAPEAVTIAVEKLEGRGFTTLDIRDRDYCSTAR